MYRKTDDQTRHDPYQDVTDRIVEALEAGTKPWIRPWNPDQAGPQSPFNPTTGKHYRGINVLLLGMDLRAFMSGDPRWMTYQQARESGWQVRKGEKSATIFFYKPLKIEDAEAEDGVARTIPMLKTFHVFHASQVDGIPAYVPPTLEEAPWQRPEAADIILKNSGAVVRIGGGVAFYSPATDHIQLPPEQAFAGPQEWAAVALHELGHWTGHARRLNRNLSGRFGSGAYAQEELRAELASAFIGSTIGLPCDIPHHASYIANWIARLREDKREIFRAAADAQKIADLALSYHPQYVAAVTPESGERVDVCFPRPVPGRSPGNAGPS